MESQLRTKDTGLEDCTYKECKLPPKHEGLCDVLFPVSIHYTNWKGTTKRYKVSPTGQVEFSSTEWHKVCQWLFEVIDCEDGKQKKFALKGVAVESRSSLQTSIEMRWCRG